MCMCIYVFMCVCVFVYTCACVCICVATSGRGWRMTLWNLFSPSSLTWVGLSGLCRKLLYPLIHPAGPQMPLCK